MMHDRVNLSLSGPGTPRELYTISHHITNDEEDNNTRKEFPDLVSSGGYTTTK